MNTTKPDVVFENLPVAQYGWWPNGIRTADRGKRRTNRHFPGHPLAFVEPNYVIKYRTVLVVYPHGPPHRIRSRSKFANATPR